MGCLDNLLTIKTACDGDVVGSSGLSIEDIGITCDEADKYTNDNYSNGQELIEDKVAFATTLVKNFINNHFSNSFVSTSLVNSMILGDYQDNLNLKAGIDNNLGGINLFLLNNSSYFNVFVSSVSLQINYDGDVDVFCYDLVSGELLDTYVVTCVANKISSKVVNKVYGSYKRKLDLIFVYDTTGKSSNTTYLYTGSDCNSCNGYTYRNYYIGSTPIYVDSSATKIRSALTNNSHTFGLSITYSIQCSFDNWLCEIANLLAMPILFKAGVEIMNYATLYSNRSNSNINIDAERNEKRKAEYEKYFNEAIEATVKKIQLPQYDKCFSCNNVFSNKVVLP